MTAIELLELIESSGGAVSLTTNGDLHCLDVPAELLEALRRMKSEVTSLLRERNRPKKIGYLPGLGPKELARGAAEYREQQAEHRSQLREVGQWPEPQTKAEKRLENLDPRLVPYRVVRAIHSSPHRKRLAGEGTLIREQMGEVASVQTPEPAAKKFEYRARTPEQWDARIQETQEFGWHRPKKKRP